VLQHERTPLQGSFVGTHEPVVAQRFVDETHTLLQQSLFCVHWSPSARQ
jgi:hypothetical protein